jgi:hypothetical protein
VIRALLFDGIDPGATGGLAQLRVEDDDSARLPILRGIKLAPLPMRARDDGGHELDGVALSRALAEPDGWAAREAGLIRGRRIVVERPAFGGQARKPQDTFRQGATWGGCRNGAELALDGHHALPEFSVLDEARADSGWRAELGLPPEADADMRKRVNIDIAERFLADCRQLPRGPVVDFYGLQLFVALDLAVALFGGLKVARGYAGAIPGQYENRSGQADALLLALLGVRRWLGLGRAKR